MRVAVALILALAAGASDASDPTIPYLEARNSGRPHECTTTVPSFFGERLPYRIRILGRDFHAIEASTSGIDDTPSPQGFAQLVEEGWRHNSVRIGRTAYSWRRDADAPPLKFDPARALAASTTLYGRREPWKDFLFLVEPSEEDRCRPVEAVEIAVPADLDFEDFTEKLAEIDRAAVARRKAEIEGLPFPVYLPATGVASFPRVTSSLMAEEQGMREDHQKSITLQYRYEDEQEHRTLRITQRLRFGDERQEELAAKHYRARWCRTAGVANCEEVAVTPGGRSVLARRRIVRRPRHSRTYYFTLGSTEVSFTYDRHDPAYERSTSPDGDPEDFAYRFAPGELERFVDSFRRAPAGTIQRIEPE